MFVASKKYKELYFKTAANLNKALENLSSDLDREGLKFSADNWKDLLSGWLNIRLFAWLKWAKKNNKRAYKDCVRYMIEEGLSVDVPNILGKNLPEYEALFGKRNYYLLYLSALRFDKKGVPFVDVAALMKDYEEDHLSFVKDLTGEEIDGKMKECPELTAKLQGKELRPEDWEPGFRIDGQKVIFAPEYYYDDMADLLKSTTGPNGKLIIEL